MSKSFIRRVMVRLSAVAILAAGLGAVGMGSASASSCYTQYCGGVVSNNSNNGFLYVANNWCWGDRSTYWGNTLPCAPSWNSSGPNSFFLLGHPDTTANYYWYYDTDAFRVDAGCRMTTWDGSTVIYDNRGSSSPMWVKINNLQRISVTVPCW
jgi:hypothetical protein